MATGALEMVPLPSVGRHFSRARRVRLGDVDPSGRLRFDALTRYTQDVSNDDTTEAALADDMAWVVRATTVDAIVDAQLGEELELTTFCGALGSRWALRRIVVTGDAGARYDVASLWIHIDTASGRPRPLSEQFIEIYGAAAEGREMKARLLHPPLPPDGDAIVHRPWPTRIVDFDTFGHMNNAAYWSAIEHVAASADRTSGLAADRTSGLAADRTSGLAAPCRATIEYAGGTPLDAEVELVSTVVATAAGPQTTAWFVVNGKAVASAQFTPMVGPVSTLSPPGP